MSRGCRGTTPYSETELYSSSSSSEEYEPPVKPDDGQRYKALLAAYLPIQQFGPIDLVIAQQVPGVVLGTQPSFTRVILNGSEWMIDGGNVTIPSTGLYELTIDACAQLRVPVGATSAAGGYSIFATLNGSTLVNVITDTISSEVLDSDTLAPGIVLGAIDSVSSSSMVSLNKGDVLGF